MVCTDGPQHLTERVRNGDILTLTGFCPYSQTERHPNERIAALLLGLTCRYVLRREPDDNLFRRNCAHWHAAVSHR